jgi:hypothetical protein
MKQYIEPNKSRTFGAKTAKVQELINSRILRGIIYRNNIVINK